MKTSNLTIYNTLTRKKEKFKALKPPFVGLYVCGPTVYGDPHLGHARPAITFDVLFRYLKYLEYKVRYVRNITDVGHLESNADEGDDKIQKKAQLEQLEPMEVVQYYTNSYHKQIDRLNCLQPSIEPHASGHIIEQQQMVKKILEKGFAYEKNGSVYFDVEAYNKKYNYGKLSGRKLEDLYENTRKLEGQTDKKNAFDFAIWKNAEPTHIQHWPSQWGNGFPGWHLECSVMSTKYLGQKFDIHGGGLDLLFPHHECEIAQSVGANGEESVQYWMHNNMITIDGQKMGKSLGNFITLEELFSGEHAKLEKAYSPMTIRFFILQAHYRSTLDFSNQALQASEKGLAKLMSALENLEHLKVSDNSTVKVNELIDKCFEALDDDLNTPVLIAHLFDGVKTINAIKEGKQQIDQTGLEVLKKLYSEMFFGILGMEKTQQSSTNDSSHTNELMELILTLRSDAKENKDYATSDKIRDELAKAGIKVKDTKDGTVWEQE